MEDRTEPESDRRKSRSIGVSETSKKRAEWRRLQRKNLCILGLLKRKEWPRCCRESSWQGRRFCQKKKEQAVCPKYQIVRGKRVKVSESRTLAREGEIRAGAWKRKGALHSKGKQVPRRRGRASKKKPP